MATSEEIFEVVHDGVSNFKLGNGPGAPAGGGVHLLIFQRELKVTGSGHLTGSQASRIFEKDVFTLKKGFDAIEFAHRNLDIGRDPSSAQNLPSAIGVLDLPWLRG